MDRSWVRTVVCFRPSIRAVSTTVTPPQTCNATSISAGLRPYSFLSIPGSGREVSSGSVTKTIARADWVSSENSLRTGNGAKLRTYGRAFERRGTETLRENCCAWNVNRPEFARISMRQLWQSRERIRRSRKPGGRCRTTNRSSAARRPANCRRRETSWRE